MSRIGHKSIVTFSCRPSFIENDKTYDKTKKKARERGKKVIKIADVGPEYRMTLHH